MYNPRLGIRRSAIALAIAAVLGAGGALPAQAHTTGPQLVSHVDGIAPAAPGVDYSLLMTSRFREELGECTVVSTGGLGDVVSPHSSAIQHHEPWLTLHGLRLIYERNQP